MPRLLLFLPRNFFRLLAIPIKSGLELEERYHVYHQLIGAFTSHDEKIGLRPAFEWAASFSPIAGLNYFDHRTLGPGTELGAGLLIGGSQIVITEVHVAPIPNPRWALLQFGIGFKRRDDQLFAGVGQASGVGAPSRYSINALDGGADVKIDALPWLGMRLGAGLGFRRFGNGRSVSGDPPIEEVYCQRILNQQCLPNTVNEMLVPGFNSGTQFFRGLFSVQLHRPTELSSLAPDFAVAIGTTYTHGFAGDESSYFRLFGGSELAVNLWQRRRWFVLKAESEIILPTNDVPVPFSELVTFGGPSTLRGFRQGILRDYSSVLFAAEYRWSIWMWAEAALFVDYGGPLGRHYSGFSTARLRPDLGFGFRFTQRSRFDLRLQIAYGFDGGWQVYLIGAGGL